MPDAASGTHADIDVCVCTFRRPSVAETLASIAAQQFAPGLRLRVVVADNDETPSAEALVRATAAALGLNLVYLHAPARNISVARNACLDAASAPLIAFIDDDETAEPDWLAQLLARRAETGAQVVLGRVAALYPSEGPAWLAKVDLHAIRAVVRVDGRIDTGYTCNVLIVVEAIGASRFDPAFGRSGGEDTLFFHALYAAGAPFAYAEAAVVREAVPPHRARLTWLLTRAFRSGQTHALMLHAEGEGRPRICLQAIAKIAYCVGSVVMGLNSTAWRRSAVRTALHTGVLARATGFKPLELY